MGANAKLTIFQKRNPEMLGLATVDRVKYEVFASNAHLWQLGSHTSSLIRIAEHRDLAQKFNLELQARTVCLLPLRLLPLPSEGMVTD